MITALGYSSNRFYSNNPDRLCRGRERWLSAHEEEVEEESIFRTVISGACFVDDSARNAQRGISYANVSIGELLFALFPEKRVVAWAEEVWPSAVPEGSVGVELFQISRPFLARNTWFARWEYDCQSSAEVDESVTGGADVLVIAPKLPETNDHAAAVSSIPPMAYEESKPSVLEKSLKESLFYLTGGRMGPNSFCRFQAKAISEVLKHCEALILLHHDKHDYCVGMYTSEKFSIEELMERAEKSLDCLTVPFSIPPMLARWDRAIWELRRRWNSEEKGEFPIPLSPRVNAAESQEKDSDKVVESEQLQPEQNADNSEEDSAEEDSEV